jgi:HD-GYP domain-containing protein (c-di-GMP phosphodiesterase class II)
MSKEKRLSEFLAYIVIALSNCSLYSIEHRALEEFSKKALSLTDELFDYEDSFDLTLLQGSLIFKNVPFPDKRPHIYRFIKKLKTNGIERVVIKKGVTLDELKSFITALALREVEVSSSPRIAVGKLEVRLKIEGDLDSLIDKSVAKVNELYKGVAKHRRLDIRGIEDIVGGFITAMKREKQVLRSLSPVKSHSVYTYVHETNVSVLTIFQAEALGLEGEDLYDAGIAGLLHDVGKLFIPKEIIEKNGVLNEEEWNTMKLHPVYGALYLSSQPDVSRTAVIAAYEHHLKYDGSGYPRTTSKTRRQHLISQLVAISDVFDALRSKRVYRDQDSYEVASIIETLKGSSGTYYNPSLVDNFIVACKGSNIL